MPAWSLAVLMGEDHPDLGHLATKTLDDRTAIVLSRGRFPKPYAHVDPNEDAVLAAAVLAGVRVLSVADGHNGFDAARAAMGAVTIRLPTLFDIDGDPEAALHNTFESARAAVGRALRGVTGPRTASRTALSLVVLSREAAWTATLGDTTVVRVRNGRAKVISETGQFLGPQTPAPPVEALKLKADDRVVAMTDGIVNYLGADWADRVGALVAQAGSAPECVQDLATLAMRGGAGDHLAAAAAWPAERR